MPPALQLALLVAILLPAVKVAASVCERWRIPPILGELLVGVALGPGAVDLLHLQIFAGGQATGALALLAQIGGFRPDVHRRARNRHRAHAQGERRRVPGRARRGHRAVRPGHGDGALVRAFFFTAAYLAAKRWLDRLLHHMLKLTANEAVPGCVFA